MIIELQGHEVESLDIETIKPSKNGRSLKLTICVKQAHNKKNAPYELYLHFQTSYQCDAEKERIIASWQCSSCINKECPKTAAPTTECHLYIPERRKT